MLDNRIQSILECAVSIYTFIGGNTYSFEPGACIKAESIDNHELIVKGFKVVDSKVSLLTSKGDIKVINLKKNYHSVLLNVLQDIEGSLRKEQSMKAIQKLIDEVGVDHILDTVENLLGSFKFRGLRGQTEVTDSDYDLFEELVEKYNMVKDINRSIKCAYPFERAMANIKLDYLTTGDELCKLLADALYAKAGHKYTHFTLCLEQLNGYKASEILDYIDRYSIDCFYAEGILDEKDPYGFVVEAVCRGYSVVPDVSSGCYGTRVLLRKR